MSAPRRALALGSVVLGALACAPAAHATSTVAVTGDTLTITGSGGPDTVSVQLRHDGAFLQVTDTSGGVAATAACPQAEFSSGRTVDCPKSVKRIVVDLGGGDDGYSQYVSGIADTVSGGAGNDELNGRVAGDQGTPATDLINGDEGNDELFAGSGDGTVCNGGGGDDYIRCFYGPEGTTFTHNGGPGRDDIVGGDGRDLVNGDSGNDTRLSGGKGNDVIHGGDGDDGSVGVSDSMSGDDGADEVFGDAGVDRLVEDRNQDRKQFWSLDDQANDGADTNDDNQPDEGDNIHSDVEQVEGGYDDDTIVGSEGPNKLDAGVIGNDVLLGMGGDDELIGAYGDKSVSDGGAGNDKVSGGGTLAGGTGDDAVDGSSGNDLIDAGPGTDTIWAGDGNDVVRAADGQVDQVACGIGGDVAEVDASDVVNTDPGSLCETVKVTAVTPGGGGGTPQNPTGNPNAGAVQLILGGAGTFKGSAATFRATVPGPGILAATVKSGSKTLGKSLKNVTGAGDVALKVKLKGKAAKKLLKKKSFKVSLTTQFTPAGGTAGAPVKKTVKLKRK